MHLRALVVATLWILSTIAGTSYVAAQGTPSATPPSAQQTQGAPAQQGAPKSFLPPRVAAAKEAAAPPPPSGFFAGLYYWIADKQRQFISTLAQSLRDIKAGNALGASLVLIAFSFAYGVLHAAGPGHGKAIVSSYILADGQTVRRGVQLAFLSAGVQALSAIAIFAIVVLVLKGARTQIASTEAWIERLSWLIVAGFGAWLLVRQLRALWAGKSVHDHSHHDHGHAHHGHHHHGHDHSHGHAHGHADHHNHAPAKALAQAHAHAHEHADDKHGHSHAHHDHKHHDHGHHHNHTHDHTHDHHHHAGDNCETCGHAHMPTAQSLAGTWSWKRAATMALAIGIRPCTGAIGVLFVANGLGLIWAGVVSTFAMAIGTAITVSVLAALAASSRDAATKLAGAADNSWAGRAQTAFGLAGALLVFVLGSTFFYYSLSTTTPF